MDSIRLLIDEPHSGPANMARDEALLQSCEAAANRPVLRFYAWNPPTISLGYFQDIEEFKALPPPAGDLAVVRRTTGGGAILHDLEITYSLTLPVEHPLIRHRPNRLYELAHDAIIRAISGGVRLFGCGAPTCDAAQRGPFFCFNRRHALDVVREDRSGSEAVSKIAGSAQRRSRRAVLQHGSIILDSRFSQHTVARWIEIDSEITFDAAVRRLVTCFEGVLEMPAVRANWSDEELAAATEFERQYAGDDWTLRRRRLSA